MIKSIIHLIKFQMIHWLCHLNLMIIMLEFSSFEDIQDCFEKEWEALHEKVKKQKNR